MRYVKNNIIKSIYEVRQELPNMSIPDNADLSDWGYIAAQETEPPTVTELQVPYQDGTELDSKGNRVVKWSIRDMFTDTIVDGVTTLKAEHEAAYTIKLAQEKEANLVTQYTNAVEAHLNTVAKSKGYNSIDTACSYAAVANPFQAESQLFVGWRGRVWMQSYGIMAEVKAGTRILPNVEDFINELEVLNVSN